MAIDLKNKNSLLRSKSKESLVELPGFEPRQTESESVVLPLHHSSSVRTILENNFHSCKGSFENYFTLCKVGGS